MDKKTGEMDVEGCQEFFDYLTKGEVPEGWEVEKLCLTDSQASAVIWFLQERYGLIPDHFEICDSCGAVYDSYSEGVLIDDEMLEKLELAPEYENHFFCGSCYEDLDSRFKVEIKTHGIEKGCPMPDWMKSDDALNRGED